MELSEQNVNKQRPVYLDLNQIQFPATAIASILHRVAGVVMFGALAVLLWLLATSLQSEAGFNYVVDLFDGFLFKLILWAILIAFSYHLCAGIRHLMMDMGYFEDSMESGNKSAQVSMAVTAVMAVIAGIWLW
ncbi:succinate dehydrogenase, cytochrome b556 subunit [Ferrimonas lipolytica]|uniref:Succinate dehydrogenase cytochrome b556 subunit n=1 Tax=Ferrimonas lipolytica TaxID=2724191 RepID=A0A6H1UAY6_9GAMM|nr:succinate dehydrogenase, cytochrome b556 subunit [Ferrimonas lipolytica]QIZ75998.1 succinate dehydrogenase, cytochrome b556 subunit [Ferrimonas lipolytica]